MSSHLKAELAATCSTLGRLHKGEYLIEPDCIESVKDLIRYLKRDNEAHEIRRYLGESKVLQNDLVHIIKSCSENSDLFDVTLRLIINLTTPTMLFYGEEVPAEKIGRNIYLSLIGYSQDYKIAFCDVEFWNKICGKLTDLFETDWSERSADDGIQIERILMLVRNVLQVPADLESEKRPENDASIHDKVLWALRQSQVFELLLLISSNKDEEQYYLNLLEIFSLILREQNPKKLAHSEMERSAAERNKETEDLIEVRKLEKKNRNKYMNMRKFSATFVMKGVKSLSDNDIVCHKSLDKVSEMDLNNFNKKQVKAPRNRIPVESERTERRSTFSVRFFLKEFCLEFLNSSFNHFMHIIKNKLDSGKSLANDQTYYFWALNFFLDFATASNLDVDLIKDFLSSECFHFVQMSIDNAFEHLNAEKKKMVDWVKRIHLILKAYRSLLEALLWMDCSKNPLTRSISRKIKSEIFYVVEYREMTLNILLLYNPKTFSVSYLRDLIETTHIFVKLLEEYSKQTKLVVQKIQKKKSSKKKKKKGEQLVETREEKWEKIKDDVYDILCCESTFPEIPPFDAALEIPIDEQKGRAMKNIQKLLHEGQIREGIGLLRSARQVWPENDHFGVEAMSVEDETMALQEICLADLGQVDEGDGEKDAMKAQEEEEDDDDDENENENLENESRISVVEQDFDIMDYKKRLANKKVVEACGILLKNYKKNSDHINHCAIKLLHRIGWECCMPALLFQASLFLTLLKIIRDKSKNYEEINTFTVNLLRKFRKHAEKNSIVFLELLFWKDNNVALEIQHGYEPYEEKPKVEKRSRKKKSTAESSRNEEEKNEKKRGRKKRTKEVLRGNDDSEGDVDVVPENDGGGQIQKRKTKETGEEVGEHSRSKSPTNAGEGEDDVVSPAAKNASNVSRVLFSDSESEDGEVNFIEGNIRQECEVSGSNESEGFKRMLNENDSKPLDDLQGIVKSAKKKGKFKKHRVKVDKSSRNENRERGKEEAEDIHSDETNSRIFNNQSKGGRNLLDSSDDEIEENGCEKASGESHIGNISREDQKSPEKIIGSTNTQKRFDEEEQTVLSEEEGSHYRKRNQELDTDAKKTETRRCSEDSEEIDQSKSKRARCIDSDSDAENFQAEDEELTFVPGKKKRRRLAVIDSDSDLETNSFHEK